LTFFSEKSVTLQRRTYNYQLSTINDQRYRALLGLYIHIPFCRSRCAYCDFFSTTREAETERYVQALCCEIESRREELPHARVCTIYIGGGTPSLLSPTLLRRILDTVYTHYEVDPEAEVTMEMNPDDWPLSNSPRGGEDSITSEGKNENIGLAALPPTGGAGRGAINRISLGIQTFDDNLLRLIRRRHDSATAIQAVRRLQDAGITNISIDLIYGLPGQSLEQWEHDLDIAFSLGIQHLSAYALSYEPGTVLTRWRDEGRFTEVPEELSVTMYERLCQRAHEAGFEHYEISNFALPGYHSRHNSSYWTGAPYLGFGPGAHGYDGLRTRRANKPSLDEYLRCCGQCFQLETLTTTALYNEAVMCALRTARGIDLTSLANRFGQSRLDDLLHMAAPHLRAGRLILDADHLRLAENALMVSDDIISDLISL